MTNADLQGKEKTMISPDEAWQLIASSTTKLKSQAKDLLQAQGSVLVSSVLAPLDLPMFNNSAMDGFAIRYADIAAGITTFKVRGIVPAGKSEPHKSLKRAEAFKIFTGALIPAGADTIVIREHVREEPDQIFINEAPLTKGAHIRVKASQLKKGKTALMQGHVIGPASIGFLASLGISKVRVFAKPKITVIITGDELRLPGEKLQTGEIFESNSYALQSALLGCGIESNAVYRVKDTEKQVIAALKKALLKSDMVILTGGISAGDYDFVKTALPKTGVKSIFYKIAQKPGKPLFYGKKKNTSVFALPGNPASVLSCFYEYVYPAIRLMQGFTNPFVEKRKGALIQDYNKTYNFALFLKGRTEGLTIHILEGQGSDVLMSFALADCLVYFPPGKKMFTKGELVDVHLIPNSFGQ